MHFGQERGGIVFERKKIKTVSVIRNQTQKMALSRKLLVLFRIFLARCVERRKIIGVLPGAKALTPIMNAPESFM
jgi:hypothetical protein